MALCSSARSTEQRLEAMKWYFGKRHCRTITFVTDIAGAQDGKYFDLNTFDYDYTEKKYKILLSDGTTLTTPVNADQTLVVVS